MRTIPAQTNNAGTFLYCFTPAWPLFSHGSSASPHFQAPAKAQQAQGVALTKAKTSVAEKAPTPAEEALTYPYPAATLDWC